LESFKTISKNSTAEIVEKKSRFIANAFYVETIEEADNYIKEIKKKYHDARHNCVAYAIETGDGGLAIKFNDDGEPSGTAGSPMLKVILEKGLSNVLVVVTRYFGGTLLGTGGLVRAYTEATIKALETSTYVNKTIGNEMLLEIEYGELEKVKYYLKKENIKIANIDYSDNIKLMIYIPKQKVNDFTNITSEKQFKILKCDILKEKYIDI